MNNLLDYIMPYLSLFLNFTSIYIRRTKGFILILTIIGIVSKGFKEQDCKSCIHRFESYLSLQRDEDEKEKNVSRMICKNFTWERIVEEMEKCDILCANCHRDHHYHNK